MAHKKHKHRQTDTDMALELTPIPIKIAPDTLAMLRAESELTGKTMQHVARQVLKEWSDQQVHRSNVQNRHLKNQGFRGIDGNTPEDGE